MHSPSNFLILNLLIFNLSIYMYGINKLLYGCFFGTIFITHLL